MREEVPQQNTKLNDAFAPNGGILPSDGAFQSYARKEDAASSLREFVVFQPPIEPVVAITPIEYGALQKAFVHLNDELFDGKLPNVLITYQRRAHSAGYFSPERFSHRGDNFGEHELALNPDVFVGQTDGQICQTLVHEMVHLWQHVFGKPSAGGYHDREWAEKMKAIGLQPSSTGKPGGKETGPRMMDYPIPGGPFERAFEKLAATGWKMNLESVQRLGPKSDNSKTKYTCPRCRANVWGKNDLMIRCDACDLRFERED